MDDTRREVLRLSGDGYCCSQIMVIMGLDAVGDENPELVEAMAGLCGGLGSGLTCGVLTGAACLLSMLDRLKAKADMIPRLVAWFKATYEPRYHGIACAEIIDGNPGNKMDRCPRMMAETYEKCRELLAECGHSI
ncbi:MAG: C-GCAxxG-C-C family protein [Acidobacteriota bacterium]|jgi:hypothetical protein|nr:C-GCAxxG-C-C family protein [Acidobacteriota bacterium]